jgi:folylpolyglutamate synthase/dihydropteroate synthase
MKNLGEWLDWISTVHPKKMDMGLERSHLVAKNMGLLDKHCPVITVAGTNGKGSCVAVLDNIYRAAGYRTATLTSPHLFTYNERICIDGKTVSDDDLCHAFDRIEKARGRTTLTYYEFTTLAALDIFKQSQPDICILEVGLGGRLDTVNLIDPDTSIITTISLDHTDMLGDTREKIALEKAGICRPNIPLVYGEADPPTSLLDFVKKEGVPIYQRNANFWCSNYFLHAADFSSPGSQISAPLVWDDKGECHPGPRLRGDKLSRDLGIPNLQDVPQKASQKAIIDGTPGSRIGASLRSLVRDDKESDCHPREGGNDKKSWTWTSNKKILEDLPTPNLIIDNVATALMAIELLEEKLPVNEADTKQGIKKAAVRGRFEIRPGNPTCIFDVAHNPQSAAMLAKNLDNHPCAGKTHAVFSMLSTKDINATVDAIKHKIDHWHIAPLNTDAAAPIEDIQRALKGESVSSYETIQNTYDAAHSTVNSGDQIIIFGSFYTVTEGLGAGSPGLGSQSI